VPHITLLHGCALNLSSSSVGDSDCNHPGYGYAKKRCGTEVDEKLPFLDELLEAG
jgi:hypothetical protein